MLLLTGNRNHDDADSLEQTMRDANLELSLPIITISNTNRVVDREYREKCATKLADIALFLEDYLGAGHLFIP